MSDLIERLTEIVGPPNLDHGGAVNEDYGHDEALTVPTRVPDVVARPASTAEVAAVLQVAGELGAHMYSHPSLVSLFTSQ